MPTFLPDVVLLHTYIPIRIIINLYCSFGSRRIHWVLERMPTRCWRENPVQSACNIGSWRTVRQSACKLKLLLIHARGCARRRERADGGADARDAVPRVWPRVDLWAGPPRVLRVRLHARRRRPLELRLRTRAAHQRLQRGRAVRMPPYEYVYHIRVQRTCSFVGGSALCSSLPVRVHLSSANRSLDSTRGVFYVSCCRVA